MTLLSMLMFVNMVINCIINSNFKFEICLLSYAQPAFTSFVMCAYMTINRKAAADTECAALHLHASQYCLINVCSSIDYKSLEKHTFVGKC